MGNSCISIESKDEKEAVIAVLTGDTNKIRSLIEAARNSPIKLARWSGDRRGVSDEGDIDSFQLSYAMYDALKNNDYCKTLHVLEMWNLHKALFPDMKRTPYEDYEFLLNDGVSEDNIRLTNYGIQHMEDEVVRLLQEGATPYFLCHAPYITEIHEDKDGNIRHTYFDVAPMLEVTKVHSVDYWWEFIGDDLDGDLSIQTTENLERIVEGIFNVGACERILHLTDKYISDKARKEGDDLMMRYLGKIHSIIK